MRTVRTTNLPRQKRALPPPLPPPPPSPTTSSAITTKTLGELGRLSPAQPVNPVLDHRMLLSIAVTTFRLLSVRLPGPGRCDPAGFSDPFGLSPGMEMTASRVPCETSTSKATTTFSTRIILAVPVRLFVQPHAAHLACCCSEASIITPRVLCR